MPAIMMRADVGFMPKVTGMSKAMPAEGPIPGSTPMIVPRKTPRNVYQRLIGCRQTAKPFRIWVSVSTAPSSEWQHADGEIDAEQLGEHQISAEAEQYRGRDIRDPFAFVEVGHQAQQV